MASANTVPELKKTQPMSAERHNFCRELRSALKKHTVGSAADRSFRRAIDDKNVQLLQVMQNKAARLVLHCDFKTPVQQLHASLSWQTVKERILVNTVSQLQRKPPKKKRVSPKCHHQTTERGTPRVRHPHQATGLNSDCSGYQCHRGGAPAVGDLQVPVDHEVDLDVYNVLVDEN
ncbi:hypothetical protein Bbelb_193340 [Branchiostoma belcheri]|nr:hypothetical protein Bbelb_193340 [Branchiostoma belcheri]